MSALLAAPNTVAQPARLSGRWLTAARGAWCLLAGYPTLLFLLGLGPAFQILRVPCDPAACNLIHWLNVLPEQARALEAAGISLGLYAAYMNGLEAFQAAVYAGCGLLIFLRRPDERFALLASLALVVLGVYLIPNAPNSATVLFPQLKPLIVPTFIWGNWIFPALLFLLPDGRFVPRWNRWLYPVWGALVTYVILTQALYGLDPADDPGNRLAGVVLPLLVAVGVGGQIHRYRRVATPQQRQQIKWIGLGLLGLALGMLIGSTGYVPMSKGDMPISLRVLAVTVSTLGASFFPIALTFAILRYRLWDIDVVLNRMLVYGGLTAAVVALYFLLIGGLSTVFHTQGGALASFLGAGLVALLAQPLRERLQRGVNRLMFGQRDEPYAVLARFGRQLETTPALETLVPAIVATLQDTLKLPVVEIRVTGEQSAVISSQSSTPLSTDRRSLIIFPLLYQGQPIGRLIVAPREGESDLSPSDRRLLEDLARQAGVAVHAARVTAELQRARERLVTAREEERLRLRRDLHDGLGPALAAVAAQAEAACDLIASQPETSRGLLEAITAQAQAATADIRRLVYNLRPPALDELGLVGAVRAQAQKIQQPNGLAVKVEADPLPPLPAAVEVAGYRIAQEALTNVVRHAQAKHCQIIIAIEQGSVRLEIEDDGRGFPERAPAGVGLASMRERAEELGGACQVTSGPSGTRVSARLPLHVNGSVHANTV